MSKSATYLFSTSAYPKAIHVNSLKITLLKPEIDFSQYDYFILTSKQATNALCQYDASEYKNIKSLCISKVTAQSIIDIGGEVLDIGEGYGDTLLCKIESYKKSSKWLYLRAKDIASNFVNIAQKNGYNIDEKIVYESTCSEEILQVDIPQKATLIFTSPSSVNCFLKSNTFTQNHKIIVIGKTTAKALPSGIKCIISAKNSIESCIEQI